MTVFILEVMSLFQLLFLNTLLNTAIRISTRLHHNFRPCFGLLFCCCRAWKVWCERHLALVKWLLCGYCFWVLPPHYLASQKCSAELCTQTTLLKRYSDGWRKGGALVYTCSRLQRAIAAQTLHRLEHGGKTWRICILVAMVDKTLW